MQKNYHNVTIVIKILVAVIIFPIMEIYYSFGWFLAFLFLKYSNFEQAKISMNENKKVWFFYGLVYIFFLPIDLIVGLFFLIYSFVFFFRAPNFHTIEEDFKALMGMAWIVYFLEKLICFEEDDVNA